MSPVAAFLTSGARTSAMLPASRAAGVSRDRGRGGEIA